MPTITIFPLYGAPFVGLSNNTIFPVMGNTFLSEEEVADLATTFPNIIYFSSEGVA